MATTEPSALSKSIVQGVDRLFPLVSAALDRFGAARRRRLRQQHIHSILDVARSLRALGNLDVPREQQPQSLQLNESPIRQRDASRSESKTEKRLVSTLSELHPQLVSALETLRLPEKRRLRDELEARGLKLLHLKIRELAVSDRGNFDAAGAKTIEKLSKTK